MDIKEIIAKRAAREVRDGDVVNLGIGIPTLIPNYLPKGVNVTLQSENGILGTGPTPPEGKINPRLVNAGGGFVSVLPGGSFFDSAVSHSIIRGGHVNVTVLGSLEVDAEGNIANWKIPGKKTPGMGGAMDLVVGAQVVIVAMTHTQNGAPKILPKCSLPLTAKGVVKKIVTEMAFIEVTKDGLVLKEVGQGFTVDDVIKATAAKLIVPPQLGRFE
jgi:acetate CoA/acetoacetate CoA-transferase beta subunit